MDEQALGTTTVVQIGVVVRDLDSKVRAWRDLFGLPAPEIKITDPNTFPNAEYKGVPTSATARLAFFDLGQVQLELIEPIGEPSTWKDKLDEGDEGLHHIAFHVKRIHDRVAFLVSKGLPLIQRGDFPGGSYAYLDGAQQLGLILELLDF
jgi:catechol 2,3-dioxygenase-like lactoylglutathione lyase family enzyme